MNRRGFVHALSGVAVPLAWRSGAVTRRQVDVVATYGVRNDGAEPALGESNAARVRRALADTATAGGGTLFFRAGRYRLGAGLTITGDTITIAGEGRSTVFEPSLPTGSTEYAWACISRRDVTFRDFAVRGTHSGGIRIHGSNGCRIQAVDISGATRVNSQGFCAAIYVSASDDLTIDGCTLNGNGRGRNPGIENDADICANMGSEQIRFSRVTNNRCLSTGVNSNIVLFDCVEVTVSGNTASGAIVSQKGPDKQGYGILLYHTATLPGVKRGMCRVADNVVRDTEGTGIFIQGMPDSLITNNTVFRAGNVQVDGSLAVGGIVVEGIEDRSNLYETGVAGRVGRQAVSGNRVSDCAAAGISLSSTTASVCSNNIVDRCRYGISVRGDSSDIQIEGNVITNIRPSGESMGIGQWSENPLPRIRIAGNMIRGVPASAAGIWSRPGSSGWTIVNNDVSGVTDGVAYVVRGRDHSFTGNRAEGRVLGAPP